MDGSGIEARGANTEKDKYEGSPMLGSGVQNGGPYVKLGSAGASPLL